MKNRFFDYNHIMLVFTAFVFLCCFAPLNARKYDGLNEKQNSFISKNLQFLNKDSVHVNLFDLVDKPTVLSLVYFNCSGICSTMISGIAELIEKTESLQVGQDYQVVTISFNHDEGPLLAAKKKKHYLESNSDTIEMAAHWHFLTGSEESIRKICDDVGFEFMRQDDGYMHPATLIILSPSGRITRYMPGTRFLPYDLEMAVKQAIQERPSPTIVKNMKYCYSNEAPGWARIHDVAVISGLIILGLALGLFMFLILKRK